jgi:hypothetical protein
MSSPAPQRSALAPKRHGNSAAGQMLMLQPAVDKQALLPLLTRPAASLTTQEPHAHNEQEADAVTPTARGAMSGVSPNFSKIPLFPPERATRAPVPFALKGIISPKLAVGAVDDPLEHEADRIAEQVMRKPHPESSVTAALQPGHKSAVGAKEALEAKAAESSATAPQQEAPGLVQEVLRSPGAPLAGDIRSFMEPQFGHDFSHVRVHTDSGGAESAQAVRADAYTVGSHIVFANGRFEPASAAGRRLLAHELAHVVQQGPAARSQPQKPLPASDGKQAKTVTQIPSSASPPKVQRQPQLQLMLPRQALKNIGNRDVNEIVDKLPQRLMNGQAAEVKQVTINGVRHKFMLAITIVRGAPPPTSKGAAETSPQTTSGPQNNIHTIPISIYERLPDPTRTLFHELVHARMEIDKLLPSDQQSETFRRYSQQLAMATDPALLIVTGTKPLEVAVLDGIAKIRSWYQTFVKGFVTPPALGPEHDIDNFLEHWVNEKFANQEAGAAKVPPRPGIKAVSRPALNLTIAGRYAGNVDDDFHKYASIQHLGDTVARAVERTKSSASLPSKDDLTKSLAGTLVRWFDALDRQMADIETFRRGPQAPAPQGAGNPYPRPLGIDGQPTR